MKWNSFYRFAVDKTAQVWNLSDQPDINLPRWSLVARLDRICYGRAVMRYVRHKTNPGLIPGARLQNLVSRYIPIPQKGFISLHFDEPVSGDQWAKRIWYRRKKDETVYQLDQQIKDQACAQPGCWHIRIENNWSAIAQKLQSARIMGTVIFTDNGPHSMRMTLLAWAVYIFRIRIWEVVSVCWSCSILIVRCRFALKSFNRIISQQAMLCLPLHPLPPHAKATSFHFFRIISITSFLTGQTVVQWLQKEFCLPRPFQWFGRYPRPTIVFQSYLTLSPCSNNGDVHLFYLTLVPNAASNLLNDNVILGAAKYPSTYLRGASLCSSRHAIVPLVPSAASNLLNDNVSAERSEISVNTYLRGASNLFIATRIKNPLFRVQRATCSINNVKLRAQRSIRPIHICEVLHFCSSRHAIVPLLCRTQRPLRYPTYNSALLSVKQTFHQRFD